MTPSHVADVMASYAQPEDLVSVFDPACGTGELLAAAVRKCNSLSLPTPRTAGIDIDPALLTAARDQVSGVLATQADFLAWQTRQVDATLVIANPPYGKGREEAFFRKCLTVFGAQTKLIFLMPLSFIDKFDNLEHYIIKGNKFGVTTGHCIVVARGGDFLEPRRRPNQLPQITPYVVHSGLKLYSVGAGQPAQSQEVVTTKPFSSTEAREGWLPCLRTGDVDHSTVTLGRMWVSYGPHLAAPKTIDVFRGPRLIVRRMPLANKRLGAVFFDSVALTAGDLLTVRHADNDVVALQRLAAWLSSNEAMEHVYEMRPSVRDRSSFPKISAGDLEELVGTFMERVTK